MKGTLNQEFEVMRMEKVKREKVKSKHSAGPWIVAIGRWANDGHDLQGRKYFHGNIHGNERDDFGTLKTIVGPCDILAEDAYLIAAAPDLLEAANAALILIRGSGFTDNTTAVKLLSAAIAKAEGTK